MRWLVLIALLLCGCVVPSPGVILWEICLAYGPKPVIRTYKPDGTIIEQQDVDSDEVVRQTVHACRD